jgi:hypothetical protein
MSENPNPTRCGKCGTMNPPNAEFCSHCHAPLTLEAGAAALEETPEAVDEPQRYEPGGDEDLPEHLVTGGLGGAAIPIPTERLNPIRHDE